MKYILAKNIFWGWWHFFSILGWSFKSFENYAFKLSAKETKWTLLEVRTHPAFLDTLILKYDFGPVKLPRLS